jgi:hypothetical protein
MNETEHSPSTSIDVKLQELYNSVSPDRDFSRRLLSQLLDRARQPQPASGLDPFLQPLAWVFVILILVLTLIWGINNLIPQPPPIAGHSIETTSRVSFTPTTAQRATQESTTKPPELVQQYLPETQDLPTTPSKRKLSFKQENIPESSNPDYFIADIVADGSLLGRVDFGTWSGNYCDRSGDGSLIAFLYDKYVSSRNANPTLRWFSLEDVNRVYEPLPDFSLQSPASFAPRDYRLAFEACPSDGNCGLYVFDIVTGEVKLISAENTWHSPVWSPDGTQIAIQLPPNEAQGYLNTIRVLRTKDGAVLYTGRADAPDSPLRNWGEASYFEVVGMERCEGPTPTPP